MEKKTVLIFGSSRNDGDTYNLVKKIIALSDYDKIDLNDYNISYYDYEHKNLNDDYILLMKNLIAKYETFIFVTPVYWYAMSGIMKVFFDRFTDLLDNEIELGRELRRKKMAVITSSIGDNLGDDFWLPFVKTSNYLGIKYVGNLHTVNDNINQEELTKFIENIDDEKTTTR
ncbi:flavodoxin family protein [Gelidibacter japonicus]|uniref:flavodoxin family protein n=1 Tax=Gelidibacter japonicus TaxID=1962232 RepID=UPI0013D5D96E|nr:NAD(P)H-dependent oxidoreductase [Gelidibacter japonicus]